MRRAHVSLKPARTMFHLRINVLTLISSSPFFSSFVSAPGQCGKGQHPVVQAFQLVVDTVYFVRHGLRTVEKIAIDKTLELEAMSRKWLVV